MTPSRFMPPRRARASTTSFVAAAVIAATALGACGSSSSHTTTSTPSTTSGGFTTQAFATGVTVTHATSTGKQSVTQPDDITTLGGHIFVIFQNGVGPQGEPMMGNKNSTVVEFSSSGKPLGQWDITGHGDGLTADPATGKVIATVNEDANSSLFVIDPASSTPVQYHFSTLPHNGGTDSISFWHGMMLISASAPGTSGKAAPQPTYPAVYVVTLNSSTHLASTRSLFSDEASAKRANSSATGTTHLALVDPDSNAVVPSSAQRFGGQFELTSQGDQEQIFAPDTAGTNLSVLKLSQSIDDSAWPSSSSGTLYIADNSADLIYKVTGPFKRGSELASVTPCDAGNAPASCPAPGFPNNYMGQVDMATGAVTPFTGVGKSIKPKGLLFVP